MPLSLIDGKGSSKGNSHLGEDTCKCFLEVTLGGPAGLICSKPQIPTRNQKHLSLHLALLLLELMCFSDMESKADLDFADTILPSQRAAVPAAAKAGEKTMLQPALSPLQIS
jgi:hypothetical protein